VNIIRSGLASNISEKREFLVHNCVVPPVALPRTLQVGVDDCLQLDINLDNVELIMTEKITGSIKFIVNKLMVKSMQIHLERREYLKPFNLRDYATTKKIFSFEVMDGCPAKDVAIPIRIPLAQYKNITPSTEAKHFDVSYFLNVTIVDTEDRRYFKQTDVKLYRESLSYCCD